MYKVRFFPEVKQDIADLPLDVLPEVKAYLKNMKKTLIDMDKNCMITRKPDLKDTIKHTLPMQRTG